MGSGRRKIVGDYELIDPIGDGSQGRVYRARSIADGAADSDAGQIVALKILRPFEDEDHADEIFQRQVDVLQALSHPHIVAYYGNFVFQDEWGEDLRCIVMEFLEGMTLKELVAKHPDGLPWERVSTIFEQCLEALIFAHDAKGITHRDIKQSNIHIDPSGGAKIIDFGIARLDSGGATATAGPRGAYDYMAPDFLNVDDFRGDEQSDIFSLGVCFYEAMTGQLPYTSVAESGWMGYLQRWRNPDDCKANVTQKVFRIFNDRAPKFADKSLAYSRENRFLKFTEMKDAFAKIQRRGVTTAAGDQYEFSEYLGKGGFGRVFRARRIQDDKSFAVKQLFSNQDPSRFQREARLLRENYHPCIVRYEDYVEVERLRGKELFLIMEYLDGMPGWTLNGRIRAARKSGGTGGLEPTEVRSLFCSYLKALDFLHEKQEAKPRIIHRDITPANLYAPPTGAQNTDVGKIFDLGIAASESTKTTGRVPGNPEYTAPEFLLKPDFRGSPQSDIYCLGLCLYKALVGAHPYPRLPKTNSYGELLRRVRGEIPVNYDRQVLIDNPSITRVLKRALALNSRDRYASAAEMLKDLSSSEDISLTGEFQYRLGITVWKSMDCTVYEAVQLETRQKVTICRIPGPARMPSKQESKQLRLCLHANLARYLDCAAYGDGGFDGVYLVFEPLSGFSDQTLRSCIKHKRLGSPADIVSLFIAYLRAMEFVHGMKLSVGLIAPHDLYVSRMNNEPPKLLNWCSSLFASTRYDAAPQYAPPELLVDPGLRPSPPADVFSLALSLYESLTDESARDSSSVSVSLVSNLPVFIQYPSLLTLLQRALSNDSADRYQTAESMRFALEEVLALLDAAEGGRRTAAGITRTTVAFNENSSATLSRTTNLLQDDSTNKHAFPGGHGGISDDEDIEHSASTVFSVSPVSRKSSETESKSTVMQQVPVMTSPPSISSDGSSDSRAEKRKARQANSFEYKDPKRRRGRQAIMIVALVALVGVGLLIGSSWPEIRRQIDQRRVINQVESLVPVPASMMPNAIKVRSLIEQVSSARSLARRYRGDPVFVNAVQVLNRRGLKLNSAFDKAMRVPVITNSVGLNSYRHGLEQWRELSANCGVLGLTPDTHTERLLKYGENLRSAEIDVRFRERAEEARSWVENWSQQVADLDTVGEIEAVLTTYGDRPGSVLKSQLESAVALFDARLSILGRPAYNKINNFYATCLSLDANQIPEEQIMLSKVFQQLPEEWVVAKQSLENWMSAFDQFRSDAESRIRGLVDYCEDSAVECAALVTDGNAEAWQLAIERHLECEIICGDYVGTNWISLLKADISDQIKERVGRVSQVRTAEDLIEVKGSFSAIREFLRDESAAHVLTEADIEAFERALKEGVEIVQKRESTISESEWTDLKVALLKVLRDYKIATSRSSMDQLVSLTTEFGGLSTAKIWKDPDIITEWSKIRGLYKVQFEEEIKLTSRDPIIKRDVRLKEIEKSHGSASALTILGSTNHKNIGRLIHSEYLAYIVRFDNPNGIACHIKVGAHELFLKESALNGTLALPASKNDVTVLAFPVDKGLVEFRRTLSPMSGGGGLVVLSFTARPREVVLSKTSSSIDMSVYVRQEDETIWQGPLIGRTNLNLGDYQFRFVRADHGAIIRDLWVGKGAEPLTPKFPSEKTWQLNRSPGLKNLEDADVHAEAKLWNKMDPIMIRIAKSGSFSSVIYREKYKKLRREWLENRKGSGCIEFVQARDYFKKGQYKLSAEAFEAAAAAFGQTDSQLNDQRSAVYNHYIAMFLELEVGSEQREIVAGKLLKLGGTLDLSLDSRRMLKRISSFLRLRKRKSGLANIEEDGLERQMAVTQSLLPAACGADE